MFRKISNYFNFNETIFAPFQIIKMEKSLFFIWLILVLLGSSLGIFFTYLLVNDWEKNTLDIFSQGSLYLISISFSTALIADLLSSLILDMKEQIQLNEPKEILFFENKIITIVLLIFLIAIMSIGYAALLEENAPQFTKFELQISLYMLAVLLGIYAFGLKYSSLHEEDIQELVENRIDVLKKGKNKDLDSKGRLL